jgi:hypothetical protein
MKSRDQLDGALDIIQLRVCRRSDRHQAHQPSDGHLTGAKVMQQQKDHWHKVFNLQDATRVVCYMLKKLAASRFASAQHCKAQRAIQPPANAHKELSQQFVCTCSRERTAVAIASPRTVLTARWAGVVDDVFRSACACQPLCQQNCRASVYCLMQALIIIISWLSNCYGEFTANTTMKPECADVMHEEQSKFHLNILRWHPLNIHLLIPER